MRLEDYIGNESIKKQVLLALGSAIKRNEPIGHMLFAGRAGCGKTALSKVIANLLRVNLIHIQPSAIKEGPDVLNMFKNLSKENPFNIIFMDEIHELPLKGQEILGIAMEEGVLTLSNGFYARRINTAPFTLIGATTMSGILSKPFIDRFGISLVFDYYEMGDCMKIVSNYISKKIAGTPISQEAIEAIARRGRGTPRILERLSDRVVDYLAVNNLNKLTGDLVEEVMVLIGLDKDGLNKSDIIILKALFSAGRPIGIENLAAVTGEDTKTISSKIEPFLIRKGFLARTGSGRMLTEVGYDYLSDCKYI